MNRIKVRGKVYEAAMVERVSMAALIRLEAETFGLLGDEDNGVKQGLTWPYIVKMNETIGALDDDDEDALIHHRMFPVYIALLVWSSKRNAGEDLTFFDAADGFTLDDLEFLGDTQDHKEPVNPPQPRAVSSRGGKRHGAGKPGKSRTSGEASNVA